MMLLDQHDGNALFLIQPHQQGQNVIHFAMRQTCHRLIGN